MKKFLVNQITKTFVTYFYAGVFVADTSTREIKNKNGRQRFPPGAFAYQFYNHDYIIMPDGKNVPMGDDYDCSGLHYRAEGSNIYTLEQVKKLFPKEKVMISNMECNGYKKVIKTHIGNWRELNEEDKIV